MRFYKPRNLIEYIRLFRLYQVAFPVSEKKPMAMIFKMAKLGKTDIWYFEEDGHFLGLAITINGRDKILIDYFATTERRRGRGNGERMLKSLISHYSPKGIFLEIEALYPEANNYSDRIRRHRFYTQRVGLIPMNTTACLFGVDMMLLGTDGCHLTYDEYRAFYLENYGRFAYDHITEPKGAISAPDAKN